MGFFITTAEAETQLVEQDGCPLDSTEYAVTLFTLDEVDATSGELSRGYVLKELLLDYAGGEFSLFFVNCEPHSAVDFDARVALFNAKAGGRLDFLPLGEDMLPLMYLVRTAREERGMRLAAAGGWGGLGAAARAPWLLLLLLLLLSIDQPSPVPRPRPDHVCAVHGAGLCVGGAAAGEQGEHAQDPLPHGRPGRGQDADGALPGGYVPRHCRLRRRRGLVCALREFGGPPL